MDHIKQVIVVRKDLKMRKGKIGAQVAHASMGALLKNSSIESNNKVKLNLDTASVDWLNGSFTKIVLGVDSLEHLLKIESESIKNNLRNCLITDSGKTEFNGNPTITCLAIGPAKSELIDKITKNLKLI